MRSLRLLLLLLPPPLPWLLLLPLLLWPLLLPLLLLSLLLLSLLLLWRAGVVNGGGCSAARGAPSDQGPAPPLLPPRRDRAPSSPKSSHPSTTSGSAPAVRGRGAGWRRGRLAGGMRAGRVRAAGLVQTCSMLPSLQPYALPPPRLPPNLPLHLTSLNTTLAPPATPHARPPHPVARPHAPEAAAPCPPSPSPAGRYILSRDYMSLKLWDVNMDAGPLAVYPVHESLRGKVGGALRLARAARGAGGGGTATQARAACGAGSRRQAPSLSARPAPPTAAASPPPATPHASPPALRPVRVRLHLRQVRLRHERRRAALRHRHLLQLLPVRGALAAGGGAARDTWLHARARRATCCWRRRCCCSCCCQSARLHGARLLAPTHTPNAAYPPTHTTHPPRSVVDADGGGDSLLEASRDPTRKRLQSSAKLPSRFGLSRGGARGGGGRGSGSVGEEAVAQDFSSKLLHLSWHPQANVVATAASNSLYLFYGARGCLCLVLPWDGCTGGLFASLLNGWLQTAYSVLVPCWCCVPGARRVQRWAAGCAAGQRLQLPALPLRSPVLATHALLPDAGTGGR